MKKLLIVLLLLISGLTVFAETISVSTINVWSGLTYKGFLGFGRYEDPGDRVLRYETLVKELKRYSPDIIAVNEANPLPSYIKNLSGDMGYEYIHNVTRGGVRIGVIGLPANLREGDAILAKEEFELDKVGTKLISGGPAGNTFSFQIGQTCQVMAGKIKVGDEDVYIFVTQWIETEYTDQNIMDAIVKNYSDGTITASKFIKQMKAVAKAKEKRIKQAEETLDYINLIAATENVILMGSLNVLSDSPAIQLFKDAGFTDAFAKAGSGSGTTYNAATNSNIINYFPEAVEFAQKSRLDYILYRGNNLKVRECRVFLNRSLHGAHLSDHYGVYAKIDVTD